MSNLKLARVAMPSAIFNSLGIRYARLRKYFDETEEKLVRGSRSSAGSSVMSRSDVGSVVSAGY
jgi:hypothetical protein